MGKLDYLLMLPKKQENAKLHELFQMERGKG
jgi:hypothetical protein